MWTKCSLCVRVYRYRVTILCCWATLLNKCCLRLLLTYATTGGKPAWVYLTLLALPTHSRRSELTAQRCADGLLVQYDINKQQGNLCWEDYLFVFALFLGNKGEAIRKPIQLTSFKWSHNAREQTFVGWAAEVGCSLCIQKWQISPKSPASKSQSSCSCSRSHCRLMNERKTSNLTRVAERSPVSQLCGQTGDQREEEVRGCCCYMQVSPTRRWHNSSLNR